MKLVMDEIAGMGIQTRVTLTDLYPVPTSSGIDYWPQSVNGACVPAELRGVRTLFASFHHFAPATAREVLKDAFDQRSPICVFEATSRTPGAIALSLLLPLLVLVITPSIRPASWFQIFFTYLVPVLPLLVFWDGLVSQLRTYSKEELLELTSDLYSPDYAWECGVVQAAGIPFKTAYLIGRPIH